MKVHDYFAGFERGIRKNRKIGRLERPIAFMAFSETLGFLRCDFTFWDGSALAISEFMDTSAGYPKKTDYSYHYVRGGQTVFRYDSAPHHREIGTFPHHKHIGAREELATASPPTLSAVFAEIEEYLGKEALPT